jgi:hypothetical protein
VKSAVAAALIPLTDDGAIDVEAADRDWSPAPAGRPSRNASPEAEAKNKVARQLLELDLEAKRMAIAAAKGDVLDRSSAVAAIERFAEAVGRSVDSWPERGADAIAHLLACTECKRRVPKKTISLALAAAADETRDLIASDVLGAVRKASPPRRRR